MSQYGNEFEFDPDLAKIAASQQGQQVDQQLAQLPPTAFVASINGEGGVVVFAQGSVPAGWTVTFTGGAGNVAIGISGPGTMSTKNVAAAIADLNQTILGPTVAEVQAISDKVDEILAVLRAAVHIQT